MALSGNERVPLLHGGKSVRLRDMPYMPFENRFPVLRATAFGLTLSRATMFSVPANTRVPLVGGGGYAFVSDIWRWD